MHRLLVSVAVSGKPLFASPEHAPRSRKPRLADEMRTRRIGQRPHPSVQRPRRPYAGADVALLGGRESGVEAHRFRNGIAEADSKAGLALEVAVAARQRNLAGPGVELQSRSGERQRNAAARLAVDVVDAAIERADVGLRCKPEVGEAPGGEIAGVVGGDDRSRAGLRGAARRRGDARHGVGVAGGAEHLLVGARCRGAVADGRGIVEGRLRAVAERGRVGAGGGGEGADGDIVGAVAVGIGIEAHGNILAAGAAGIGREPGRGVGAGVTVGVGEEPGRGVAAVGTAGIGLLPVRGVAAVVTVGVSVLPGRGVGAAVTVGVSARPGRGVEAKLAAGIGREPARGVGAGETMGDAVIPDCGLPGETSAIAPSPLAVVSLLPAHTNCALTGAVPRQSATARVASPAGTF